MGYTHYWRRQKDIEFEAMKMIVDDFKKVLPELEKLIPLAGGLGQGDPTINYNEIWFNGSENCGHPKNSEITIPWPSMNAGGIVEGLEKAEVGKWFAGALIEKRVCDGNCAYETFYFPRILSLKEWEWAKNGKCFNFCKTAFRPYDLAVITFLIILKHHLGDKIRISSDGEDCHWFDGKLLCQMILGYGLEFRVTKGGILENGGKKSDDKAEDHKGQNRG